jgi:hypothetical protein
LRKGDNDIENDRDEEVLATDLMMVVMVSAHRQPPEAKGVLKILSLFSLGCLKYSFYPDFIVAASAELP